MDPAQLEALLDTLCMKLLESERFRLMAKDFAAVNALEFAKATERIREDGAALFIIQWAENKMVGLYLSPQTGRLACVKDPGPELSAAITTNHDAIVAWLKEHQAEGLEGSHK